MRHKLTSRSCGFVIATLSILLGLSQTLIAQAPQLQLPSGAINQTSTPGVTVTLSANYGPTFVQFLAAFDAVPGGYSIGNKTYNGWCVDPFSDFVANPPYNLISTYDSATLANPPGGGRAQNPSWNMVNWVLNNKPTTGTAPTWIVQQVIWKLLTGQYIQFAPGGGDYPAPAPADFPLSAGDTAIANALYTAALAQGSFVPAVGQTVGVMLYVDGINPDGTSATSNQVVSQNSINPNIPPLNGLNGQPNNIQEILIEVPVPAQGAIGDYVWQDTNQNGIQDAGEPGINGVTVQLCADAGCSTILATTQTVTHQGLNGYYQFTDLGAGTYYVSIDNSQPTLSGLVPTQTGQGTPATDSNPNPSQVILPTNTSVDETIDFGYTSPGASAIGDFVWNDSNGNGLQDAGEPGIPGVTVNLCSDAACSTILATTTTDQNGAYHFTGLLAGTYYVVVVSSTLPPGFVASPSQVGFPGNAAIDSNGSPAQVILPENFTDNTIDFGYVPPAQGAIGDFVWHDLNRNGIQDNDSNNNPEPGINNVTIRLFNSSNTQVGITTTITNSGHDGYYQFTGLSAGTYTVVVDSTTLPPGFTPTTSNAPGSTTANDSNGSPATVTLPTNSSVDETIDFGYVTPCVGAIGDFVWNDANQNGIQDAGEAGIPGATVYLRKSDNTLITSTTTDQNGAYHFTGLCADTYIVQVVTPAGFMPTTSMAPGSTPANDSNGSPATVVLGVDATDNTIDFGFYLPLSVGGQCLAGVNSGEVGVPFNSSTPTVNGGMAPYTFSVATGTLPMGLTLDATTGIITGTPLAAGNWTLQVTDANNTVLALQCPYTVVPAPAVTCSSISQGEVGVPFNSGAPTVTGGVQPYTFSIVGTLPNGLTLDTTTGIITGIPTATGTFTLQVTDANHVTGTPTCPFTIVSIPTVICASTTSGEVGVPFSSGAITVNGGVQPYTYTIVGTLPAGLTLNPSNGAITGTPTAAGTFTIQVKDANGVLASTTCPITIAPGPTVTCASATSGEVGVPFSSGAITVNGGVQPYTYTIVGTLPAGLTLNPSNGAITGTPTAAGTFSIQVKDSNGVIATTTCPITIVPGLTVTCSGTNTGTAGVAFNSGPITVTGGTMPYTFSIGSGTLPAGLTLNTTTGAVTGLPTTSGTFIIKVTDAKGAVGTGCSITINPGVVVTCGANNTGTVGVPFNSGPITVTGGTGPYTFTVVGNLPNGLYLNPQTGAVTGTPTQPGTFSIQATDSQGHVGSCRDSGGNPVGTSCTITISPAPLTVTCGTTNTGVVGVAFNSGSIKVTGGASPYTFTVVGTLPAGLSLNSSTGAVTGTPTAAGTFSISVKDSKGNVATTTCSITITPPQNPHVTCGTNNTGTVGTYFSSGPVNVSGGTGPYTFTVIGKLPAGLTLNTSTGAVTGTPTQPGTFSIQATDSKGKVGSCQDSQGNPVGNSCAITINPAPLAVTCGTNSTGTVGTSFNSGSINVTGGVSPYTFTVVGTLPNGLSLNSSTGAVTGTPTAAGTFSISVKDSKGNVATTTCSITITPPQNPHVTCGTNNTGTVGTYFSSGPVNVSGGTGPYTFTVVGKLPAGLTLNTSTGAVTGTPTQPGTFSIQATDSKGKVGSCQDSQGNPVGNSCAITINPAPLTVTCGTNNTGTVGTYFNSGSINVNGGVSPYTFTVVGTLPNGLSLNSSTGAVTGTPQAAGTFSISVKDSKGTTASTNCSITITPKQDAHVVVTCGTDNTGTVGTYFSSGPIHVSGGTGSYTFTVKGTLPRGLSLNSSTGAVTGTPLQTGTFSIQATDSQGHVGSCSDSHGNPVGTSCSITISAH